MLNLEDNEVETLYAIVQEQEKQDRYDIESGLATHNTCLRVLNNHITNTITLPQPGIYQVEDSQIYSIAFGNFSIKKIYHNNVTWNIPVHMQETVPLMIIYEPPVSIRLLPIPGITPDNWKEYFPPFHYDKDTNQVCFGSTVFTTKPENLQNRVSDIENILSIYNTDSAHTLRDDCDLSSSWTQILDDLRNISLGSIPKFLTAVLI